MTPPLIRWGDERNGRYDVLSLNDVLIKFLSDAYPLHEVVLVRSVIGMMAFLIFILPFTGGLNS